MTPSPTEQHTALVNRAEDLTWFDTLPGEQMAYRVRSRDVNGAFTIVEARVPPLVGPPMHYHEGREEIFEILSGTFRFLCAGDDFEAGPGTTVVIPRKAAHAWVNLGPGVARLLFTFVPGGADEFFPLIGKTAPDELSTLAQRHDTWIVGSPISVATSEL